jgi:hypothetical protein
MSDPSGYALGYTSSEQLGDLATLADRLQAEVHSARSAVTSIAVIGAWSRLG